jgi:small subunit ribosomal protein S15
MSVGGDFVANKKKVISDLGRHAKDVGSTEVQIGIFTKKLEQLTKHFEKNPNDTHSRRGMFRAISKRKRLLEYLRGENLDKYKSTIAALGLRK